MVSLLEVINHIVPLSPIILLLRRKHLMIFLITRNKENRVPLRSIQQLFIRNERLAGEGVIPGWSTLR